MSSHSTGTRPITSSVWDPKTVNRTRTAALLVSDVTNPFYADVVIGVEEVASSGGYEVFLCNTAYDLDRGMAFIRSLIDKRVDGVLVMSSRMSDAWLNELRRSDVPAVVLDWNVANEYGYLASLHIDFAQGITTAVEHLMALGHRRFAHISGPRGMPTARLRRECFLDALAERGIDRSSVLVVEGDLQIQGGRQAARQIVAASDRPTAILAANDLTAIGALNGLRSAGIAVPEDMSIVGIDNIWLSDQTEPSLTTIGLPRHRIGEMAMQLLLSLLDESAEGLQRPPEDYIIEPELVIRQSTSAAPATDSH